MNELHIDKTNWKKYRFGDVAIQTKEVVDIENTDLTRYVAGEHMFSEDIHLRKWGTIGDGYLGPAFIRKFNKGDILYGSRRTYLKKVAIADFDGITANTTFVIKANEDLIEPVLLAHLMLSHDFTEYSVKNSRGSVNPYINWKDIADYEFLLPPKAEQKRLAKLLWAADEVVEKEKRELEKLDLFRQSKLKDIFKSANTHTRLKDLPIEEINGLWKTDDHDSIDVSVIRSTEFSDYGTICFDKLEPMPVKVSQYKTRKLYPADIIVERSGGGPDQPVGRVCYFEQSEGEYSFSNFTSCLRVADSNVILPKYLFYFLEYYWEMGGTDRIQNQTTGIRNLDYELYKMIKVPMLSIEKQKQAIGIIDQIQLSIFAMKSQIEQSQQIKQELINKVF